MRRIFDYFLLDSVDRDLVRDANNSVVLRSDEKGLRKKAFQDNTPIIITDIKPGFVDTDMAKGEGKFWVATPQQAAEQIYSAIQRRKKHAYITHRWRLIGWVLKLMPNWLYQRIA